MNKRFKINLNPLNKKGAITLATTVVASSMLITISLSSSRLMTREVRMSTRVDSSTKAYFAAEAGVEDALRRLKNDASFREENGSFTIFEGSEKFNDVKWIKRDVSDKTFEFTGYLVSTRKNEDSENYKSATIDLSGIMVERDAVIDTNPDGTINFEEVVTSGNAKKPSYIVIEWNNPLKGDSANVDQRIEGLGELEENTGYDGPAAIELGVTSWPSGTINNYTEIKRNSVFIRPQDANKAQINNLTLSDPFTHRSQRIWLKNISNHFAIPQADIRLRDLSFHSAEYNHILRIKSIYSDAHFRVRVYHDNNSPDNFNDDKELAVYGNEGYLQIDVTGYADGAYRRIVVRKPRGGTIYSIFDYVLFAKEDYSDSNPIKKGRDNPWLLNF